MAWWILIDIYFIMHQWYNCWLGGSWLGKDYKIGLCCFSTKHASLRRKSKTDWLGIGIMYQSGVTCLSMDCSTKQISSSHCNVVCTSNDIAYKWLTWVRVMVFNDTFNNISVISWRSVLLMEETGVPGENHRPVASHWQTLSLLTWSQTLITHSLYISWYFWQDVLIIDNVFICLLSR